MKTLFPVLLCGLAALLSMAPAVAVAQDSADEEPQIPALFSSDDLIEFTIET